VRSHTSERFNCGRSLLNDDLVVPPKDMLVPARVGHLAGLVKAACRTDAGYGAGSDQWSVMRVPNAA
jgi:hypothetical protein